MRTLQTALFWTTPWTLLMLIFWAVREGEVTQNMLISTLLGGLCGGLLFALFIRFVGNRVYRKVPLPLREDEEVLMQHDALYLLDDTKISGKLALTNQRVIFRAYLFNLSEHYIDLALQDITQLTEDEEKSTELEISLGQTRRHRFVVPAPGSWIQDIRSLQNKTCKIA